MPATAWYVSLALIAVIGVIFLYVAFSTARTAEYASVQPRAYRIRAGVFWLLILAGIAIVAITMPGLPYLPRDAAPAAQVVNVEASQFSWDMDNTSLRAGEPVDFVVTSADVNHGLGIYDSDDVLVAQVQAMPGYTNHLRHTFDRPGTYHINCLEYCGTAHYAMVSDDIEVSAAGAADTGAPDTGASDSGTPAADATTAP